MTRTIRVLAAVAVLAVAGPITGAVLMSPVAVQGHGVHPKTLARGTLSLYGESDREVGLYDSAAFTVAAGECEGTGGYSDITIGADVTVTNAAGHVIATGELGAGKPQIGACVFPFTVRDIPADLAVYRIEVSHRGSLNEKMNHLDHLAFTLGND